MIHLAIQQKLTNIVNKLCFTIFFFFKNGGAQDRLLNVVRTESLTTHRG